MQANSLGKTFQASLPAYESFASCQTGLTGGFGVTLYILPVCRPAFARVYAEKACLYNCIKALSLVEKINKQSIINIVQLKTITWALARSLSLSLSLCIAFCQNNK